MRYADHPVLYLVLQTGLDRHTMIRTATAGLEGGVDVVQLREKELSDAEILSRGEVLRKLTTSYKAQFFVNDRVDLALACEADGVHLGVNDLPVSAVRKIASAPFQIGYSPETEFQIESAAGKGATYLGIGPLHSTSSKRDAGAPLGFDGLKARIAGTDLPVIAIGGVTPADVPDLMRIGVKGVAVMSAITRAPDPEASARQFRTALDTHYS